MLYIIAVILLMVNYKLLIFSFKNPHKLMKFDRKIKTLKNWACTQGAYAFFYKYAPVKSKHILLESHLGHDMGGNPYYLLLELLNNEQYKNYKCYVVGDKLSILQKKKLKNKKFKIIKYSSILYYYHLATAKFLINDVTFKPFFIKKDDQCYLNTWHGTPLKAMGRNIEYSPIFLSNTQRNFMHSDLLLAPNQHVVNMYKDEYMLEGMQDKKIILSGYPRNDVFYKDNSFIKQELNIENKEIITYMPTWRGGKNKLENMALAKDIERNLQFLNDNMPQDKLLFVKLHPLASTSINVDQFENIHSFPLDYEMYEFLSQASILITDYSSVLFDYANSQGRIILFCDDYEEYTKERGFSLDYFDEIPFAKAYTKEDLLELIKYDKLLSTQELDNIRQFKERFCTYDSKDGAKNLCLNLIENNISPDQIVEIKRNESLSLIYTGQFLRNGITTSFLNLLSNLDLDKNKIVCNFNQSLTKKEAFEVIVGLPGSVSYIPNNGTMLLTLLERLIISFKLRGKLSYAWANKIEEKVFKREVKRLYANTNFDNIINFTGYDRKACLLYKYMTGNKTIFVHNDMEQELKNRNNYSSYAVLSAWKSFNHIAMVRESLYQSCVNLLPEIEGKLKLVHNTINFNYAKTMSEADLDSLVDIDTCELLKDDTTKKIITIGRFSSEKGHLRLIDAFDKIADQNSDLHLYIMGGHGDLYANIVNRVNDSPYSNQIHLLVNISNPYPILKKMNLFILPSYYEGLPMVFFESILMNVPIVSVDIPGPAEFLNQGYGHLVKNSTSGLEDGMRRYLLGEIKPCELSLEDFNKKAVEEFKNILSQ